MIFLIPLAIWLGTAVCFLAFYNGNPQAFRRSLLTAAIGIFFFIATSTELLSPANLVNTIAIKAAWTILNIALMLLFRRLSKREDVSMVHILKSWRSSGKAFFSETGGLTNAVMLSILGLTCIVAVVATPNNMDSMAYHLSRLGYWIQNENVDHYASHIERSISFSPFSEYVHLHSFLLSGSERAFQLLQWSCLVGILMYISLLVEMLSGSRAAMRMALCFGVTLPIVVLESMTTQNDIVVAFFIVACAFYAFDYVRQTQKLSLILIAAAAALGMMTKGTFAFFVLPFAAYIFFFMIAKPSQWKPLAFLIGGSVIVMLLLNGPFWYRTYQIYESPIGTANKGNKNDISNPANLLSSTAKHVFLHLGFVSPGDRYNRFMASSLERFHQVIGIPLNSPGTGMPFKMNKLNFNEDFAHNFFAMWLIIFSLPILFFIKLSKTARWYTALAFLSFLLFCFFIGYQIYGSRLHISFFLLIAPVIGIVYGSLKVRAVPVILSLLLWFFALPFAVLSTSHPLLSTNWFFEEVFPKINTAFNLNIHVGKGNLNLKQPSILFAEPEKIVWGDYTDQALRMRAYVDSIGAKNIGFNFLESSLDYAYQYVLRAPDRHFEHVLVRNPSRSLENKTFIPDCIIAEHFAGNQISYHGRRYEKKWSTTGTFIYVPVN
ncbi:glycosyltransferase family 39 protein [Dyadobacter sp. LJ53]|uniref:ArnT family glycosyltransferase n=1 Tax=Dyadobacter chenwenxiniae TaxID=2906456 RepID=UPI001F286454|nr:glycosyltransferase family 39 protein [Dyadobacter chenwenxiniae]MCF0050989.1 glycosyltransferase family 39 protein [Dyadobacter chenwenxiniae]